MKQLQYMRARAQWNQRQREAECLAHGGCQHFILQFIAEKMTRHGKAAFDGTGSPQRLDVRRGKGRKPLRHEEPAIGCETLEERLPEGDGSRVTRGADEPQRNLGPQSGRTGNG